MAIHYFRYKAAADKKARAARKAGYQAYVHRISDSKPQGIGWRQKYPGYHVYVYRD